MSSSVHISTTSVLPPAPLLGPSRTEPIDIPRLALSGASSKTSVDTLTNSPTLSTTSSASSPSTAASCCDTCCAQPDSLPISIPSSHFKSVLIIGAGPHSLALAARMAEARPAALYTDLEHARLSWLRRERNEKDRSKRRTVKGHWPARKLVESGEKTPANLANVKILDSSSSSFMGRWNTFFDNLELEHLRSPMIFHPAPADADALVAYARREGREDELKSIDGVVGAEQSKYQRKKAPKRVGRAHTINERERQDYFRPGSALFRDFIDTELISRYQLSSLVTQATVTSVTYGPIHVQGEDTVEGMRVVSRMPDGSIETIGAKAVVFAVGPSSKPNIPAVISQALPRHLFDEDPALPWRRDSLQGEAWCHSAAFALEGFKFLSERIQRKVRAGKPTTVVVIGGGLTSAQISDLCVKSGVSCVVLICRGRIKVKHFDFDLEWVSKYNNLCKSAFWQEDDRQARHAMIQGARDGGSVNPQYLRILNAHVKNGSIELKTFTEVASASYDPVSHLWSLETRTSTPAGADMALLHDVDYVVCSTGSKLDFAELDCAKDLIKSHPLDLVNGLPCLTSDLQWSKTLPVFVMGAYAMLELGPDALNLSGTRHGAERIVHRLDELGLLGDESVDEVDDGGEREAIAGGEQNYFDVLGNMDE